MNNFKKTMIVGMTVLSMGAVSFGAQAQAQAPGNSGDSTVRAAPVTPPPAPGMAGRGGPGGHEGRGRPDPKRMEERMAKRAARLHDELKLSAAQEPAWKTFVESMKPTHPPGPRPDRDAWKAMSAPERMERQLAHMKTAEADMTTRLAALKTFYAVLTPEQQKVFNEKAGHGPMAGRRGHGPRGHERGGPGDAAPAPKG